MAQKKGTAETPQYKPGTRYKAGTKSIGLRSQMNLWAMFKVLAQSHGVTANAAMNRLMAYAIVRGWVPEYIPNPQLPVEIPPKEQEVKSHIVYERPGH